MFLPQNTSSIPCQASIPKSVGALLAPPGSVLNVIMLTAGLRRRKNGLFSGSLEVSLQASDGGDWVKGILC